MGAMVRKQVYIELEQQVLLKRLAARRRVTEAEIVREALDRVLLEPEMGHSDGQAWAEERRYIADLMARGPVEGGRTWTREDLHER